MNSSGPIIDPCGTPQVTLSFEIQFLESLHIVVFHLDNF